MVSTQAESTRMEAAMGFTLLRALLDAVPEIVCIRDMEGRHIMANAAGLKQLGLGLDQVLGRTDEEIFPAAMAAELRAQDKQVMGAEGAMAFSMELGEGADARHFSVTKSLLKDDTGLPIAQLTITRDSTEGHNTEGQLSRIRELYRSVVERQREMICRFSPDGLVTFNNTAFQRFFQHRAPGWDSIVFNRLFPEDEVVECRRRLAGLTPKNPSCVFEVHNYDSKGAMVWQQWYINASFGAKDELAEFQAVGVDITQRKEAEDKLAASEARWRSVFESADDLILTVNAAGLILSANEPTAHAFGLRPAGRMLRDVMSPSTLAISTAALERVFMEKSRQQVEFRAQQGPLNGRLFNCVLTPVFHKDRVVSATIIARDITDQRMAEIREREAIVAGQESERGRVSRELHDGLGQLFTAIRLNAEHLRTALEASGDRPSVGRLQLLEQNLAKAIAEVKHISQGLMPDVLSQFGLRPALEELISSYGKSGTPQVSLQITDFDQPLPQAMELALFRIAQELLNNAVRHSHAQAVFVQLIRYDQSIVLMVEDDGCGFDPAQVTDGNGLKNIQSRAGLLGGSVDMDSSAGGGTVTTVEIPLP